MLTPVERKIAKAAKRRAAMAALRARGWGMQAIADRYRITRQRVHQILSRT